MGIYDIPKFDELVKGNSYVGRGIIVGKSADAKKAVTAYFIMGRSTNSRNRVFIETPDGIIIKPFDPSKLEDPSLVIYSPVREFKNYMIVTNGDQTDTVYKVLEKWESTFALNPIQVVDMSYAFEVGLSAREFEPDGPNWTPRISAMLSFLKANDFTYKMSILKSADAEGSTCNRYTFNYNAVAGLGHFIHTYNHDGNPIPTFTGEPERVAVPDDIEEYTETIWNGLDENNKVSLYVAYVDLATGRKETRIINKNK